MAPGSPGRAASGQGWYSALPPERTVRPDVPPAKGILRDDLDLPPRRPQVIRVERHEEVRPDVWRYTVPRFVLEGRSRQPLLDGCRRIKRILGPTGERAGLFRKGRPS